MACPTCDHTMQSVGDVFWCPRCGSVKTRLPTEPPYVPKLVARVRQLMDVIEENAEAVRLGIRESIGPKGESCS